MKYSIYVFYFCFLLPPALSISIGGLVLSPLRVFGIICTLSALYLLNKNSRHLKPNVRTMDLLILFHCIWALISISMNQGVVKAIESGGIYCVEVFGFYCFGRAVASSWDYFVAFLKSTMVAVSGCVALAWFETLTGVNVIATILGITLVPDEPRFGLARASVSLPHPILYGLFASVFIGLYIKSRPAGFYRNFIVFFMAAVPSLSSAPLLSVVMQGALLFWDRFFPKNLPKWKVLITLFFVVLGVVSLMTNRPIVNVIISYASFNPGTGYYRLLIWDYGYAEVLRHPVFGMGMFDNNWVRPYWMTLSTIDNFWLLIMMKYGFLGLFSLFSFKILVVKNMLQSNDPTMVSVNTGWIISMVSIVFVGATVAFWANAIILYAAFLGLGSSLASRKRV